MRFIYKLRGLSSFTWGFLVLSLQFNTLENVEEEEELLVVIYDLRNYSLALAQLLFGASTMFFLIYMFFFKLGVLGGESFLDL